MTRPVRAPLSLLQRAGVIIAAGALIAFVLLQVSRWQASSPATAATPLAKGADSVRVTADQMHQLQLVAVKSCAFQQMKQAIGQIAFNEDASTSVVTPFSGRITRLLAKIGDSVKRGDPLFEIDSPEVSQAQTELIAAVLALGKSRSQLELAKRVAARQEALLKDKATAQREVEQARTDLAGAESDFRTAEGALSAARNRLRVIIGRDQSEVEKVERDRIINPLITINAPIDGTIIGRKVGPGQYVRSDAADALYSISDLSIMWLKAYVQEADIPFVRAGQQIEVKVTALPNKTFQARIIAIGAYSDQLTRRIVVRSEIPNPDRVLKADMFATFKITVGEAESVPAVPPEAVIREGGLASIWVQKEPMTFQRRTVKIGGEQNGCVQVSDGVKTGEFVVARGAVFVDNASRQ